MSGYWIGIDTGGTFTDLVLVAPAAGRWHYHKVPTRTADPAQGILDGVAELLQLAAVKPAEVEFLVLGTTLATNAVLEGKWARTGLITTQGFRDVLELARQRRPHYFNLDVPKPMPPTPRDCSLEVSERLAADGSVVRPLDEQAVADAVRALKDKKVEAIAICFLHSYQNDAHEKRAAEIVRAQWPDVYLCTSSEVLPEFREFERCASTAVNASLMPIMDRYLERFGNGTRALGIASTPRVMQSNGGAVTPAAVRKLPINTFFSGPAGGVIGSVGVGTQTGITNLITFDMGGTSTDVCLIKEGEPAKKSQREMGGFPVRTRTIDIHTIGAGGGSIAWIDAGGLLKVGPKSAGAYPGPAAYGRGGTLPTVTDANVVLGRLNPVSLLGGRMEMHADKARAAIDDLSSKLGISAVETAAGILEIVNVNMMGAVRVISVEQGEDPRDFTFVAFGGAGPLHATDVARTMGIRRVLVPPRPGLLSAQGLLYADQRGDFSLTRLLVADAAALPSINAGFEELQQRAAAWLAGEATTGAPAVYEWQADLRYVGQNFELILPVDDSRLDAKALGVLQNRFHARHKDFYGYDIPGQPVELVNLRVSVTVRRERPGTETLAVKASAAAAEIGRRPVWFADTGFVDTPVLDRDRLQAGITFTGPAIVEQMDTTTVIPPQARVKVDAGGYLHVEVAPALDAAAAQEAKPWAAAPIQ